MLPLPTLLIRFDIGKLNSGGYGYASYKVLFSAADAELFEGCAFFDGDSKVTLYSGNENVNCIAVQHLDTGRLEQIKATLERDKSFRALLAATPFAVMREPPDELLVNAGQIRCQQWTGADSWGKAAWSNLQTQRVASAPPVLEQIASKPVGCPTEAERDSLPVKENAEPPARLPTERPLRAVWLICFAAVSWFLLIALQSAFAPRAMFSADALYFCVATIIGTTTYFVTRRKIEHKLIATGAVVLSAILLAISEAVVKNPVIYGMKVPLVKIFDMGNVLIGRALPAAFAAVGVAFALTGIVFSRVKPDNDQRRVRISCGAGAIGFFVVREIHAVYSARMFLSKMRFPDLFSVFSGALFDAACVFAVSAAAYALCNIPSGRIRTKGLGLVWCWIATFGMAASVIAILTVGFSGGQQGSVFTAQLLLALFGLAGYVLLLAKRRVGLYFILLGAGLTLGALIVTTLSQFLYGSMRFAVLFVSLLLGALNPLFAWLSVRAARDENARE